jgi:hypothetical protein
MQNRERTVNNPYQDTSGTCEEITKHKEMKREERSKRRGMV